MKDFKNSTWIANSFWCKLILVLVKLVHVKLQQIGQFLNQTGSSFFVLHLIIQAENLGYIFTFHALGKYDCKINSLVN